MKSNATMRDVKEALAQQCQIREDGPQVLRSHLVQGHLVKHKAQRC